MSTESKPRGFAAMDKERVRELASRGGKAVAPENRSFARDPSLASRAGRIGGANVPDEKRAYSKNLELAKRSAVKGGAAPRHRGARRGK